MGEMTDVMLRIKRSKKHLNILNREVRAFMASKPYRVEVSIDPKDGRYIIRPYLIKQCPVSWGLLIGEVVHGLRSALDNMAWSLAIKQDTAVSFPIFINRNEEFDKKLKLLREDVRTDIEAVQPYNAPNGKERMHPLWLLRITDNIDKHRIILPGAIKVYVATGLPSPPKYFVMDGFRRLAKGTVELRLSVQPNLKENFKPESSVAQIQFDISSRIPGEGSNPHRLTRNNLLVIYNFVRDEVYPRFAKFLKEKNMVK